MLRLYHLVVGVILFLETDAQNPFVFNATLEQRSAASNDELRTNITDLIDDRGQPILAGEEGVSAHLSASIIELTVWQREMLITHFSSLMVDLTVTDGPGVVCPTTYGLQLRYMTMFRQNCQRSILLQVLSVIQFFECQHSIPPGSCLEQQTNPEAPYCYCCLRHRTQSVLAVDVRSCATGVCQVVIENVNAPYCTCCHDPPAETTSVDKSPSHQSTTPSTSDVPTTSTDQTTSKDLQTSRSTTTTPWSSPGVSTSSPFYTTSNPRFTSRVTTARQSSTSSKTAPLSSSTADDLPTTTRQAKVTSHTSSNPTTPPTNRVSTKPSTAHVHCTCI